VNFIPDTIGDLAFNGIASNVYRNSFLNGLQSDNAVRLNEAHTLRTGFIVSDEQTQVTDMATAFGLDPVTGLPLDLTQNPLVNIRDSTSKLGWIYGLYVQD
jgi:hypothetical protein